MEMEKTTAAFTFKNVDQLKNEFSTTFVFRDIQWRIQFQRIVDHYRVYLHCGKEDKSNYWSINASVAFRLVPFSFGRYTERKCYERSLGAFQFSMKRLNCGISNFITVEELNEPTKQLVRNNCIHFEAEINACNEEIVATKRAPEELMEIEEKRFSFQIADISEITANLSSPFFFGDIPWQLVVSKYKTGDKESLGCHLSIDQKQFKVDDKFSCEVAVQYELQSQKDVVVYSVQSEFYAMNALNSFSMPLKHLVTLNDLFDEKNGYVHNDAIHLKGNFKIKLPNDPMIKKAKRMKIDCPVCFDDLMESTMYSTECGHIYCEKCIVNPVKTKKKCAICGKMLATNKIHPVYLG